MSNTDVIKKIVIDYTDYKSERHKRSVIPMSIFHGTTEYHTKPQWFLVAFDIAKYEIQTFAMKDIHSWIETLEEENNALTTDAISKLTSPPPVDEISFIGNLNEPGFKMIVKTTSSDLDLPFIDSDGNLRETLVFSPDVIQKQDHEK